MSHYDETGLPIPYHADRIGVNGDGSDALMRCQPAKRRVSWRERFSRLARSLLQMAGTNGNGNGGNDRLVLKIIVQVASLGLAVTFVGALMERNADRVERSHHEDMVLMQSIGDKAVEGHHQILMELQAQRLRRGEFPTPPPRHDPTKGFENFPPPIPPQDM